MSSFRRCYNILNTCGHLSILISSILFQTSYQIFTVKPVMLEGNYVLLRPPLTTDVFGLSLATKDGEIWNNPNAFFPHENDISEFLKIY